MSDRDTHQQKRVEIDIWVGMLRQRAREYERQGIPLEEAEERAALDIRREIRQS